MMDVENLRQMTAASVTANGTIEAAKIMARATLEASRNTLYAAGVAIVAGASAITAAYISTWQARRAHKAEWDGYRHLIGGLFSTLLDEIRLAAYFAEKTYNALLAGAPETYHTEEIGLPPELQQEHWKQHAILGPKFARHIVLFRSLIGRQNRFYRSHTDGWDLRVQSRGLFPNDRIFKHHLDNLHDLERVGFILDSCTKTVRERFVGYVTARFEEAMRRRRARKRAEEKKRRVIRDDL